MRETIDRLRAEPTEHRTLAAAIVAIAVVAILFIGWLFLFVHDLGQGQLQYTRPSGSLENSETAASSSEDSVSTSSAPAAGLNGF
jgi:hypothetical protein